LWIGSITLSTGERWSASLTNRDGTRVKIAGTRTLARVIAQVSDLLS
jgi:hypothetical protein